MKKFLSAAEQAAESEDLMEFFNSAVDTLQTIVVGLGGALCVWGGINLLEGYGQDNPGSKSQGVKQLVAGGGVALIGVTLVPLLSGLLGYARHRCPQFSAQLPLKILLRALPLTWEGAGKEVSLLD